MRLESAARHRHRVAVDLQGRGAVLQAWAVRHVQHRRHTTTFQIDRVRRRGNDRLHPTLVDRPAIIDVRGHECDASTDYVNASDAKLSTNKCLTCYGQEAA